MKTATILESHDMFALFDGCPTCKRQSAVYLMTCRVYAQQRGRHNGLKTIREKVGVPCERMQEPAEPFLLQDATAHLAVLPEHIIIPDEIMARNYSAITPL